MDEFKEGDKVRAVAIDGTVIEGIVDEASTSGAWVTVRGVPLTLRFDGWSLSLVERAKPELPKDAGWYLTRTNNAVYLAADGYWTTPADFWVTGEDMRDYAPFTRLEPVAETARKVLDAVIARTTMHCNACSGHLADIRKEFGASNV